jgi:hypothetical protein
MIADRKTVAENFQHNALGFTREEDLAYPDLVELISRLHEIQEGFGIEFGTDKYNYDKDFVEGLLLHGDNYSGKSRLYVGGKNGECHDNVIELVKQKPHLRVIRGWAINGCWKGHSWAWEPAVRIVHETTDYDWRDYFGWDVTDLFIQKNTKI